jgi:hypothetical protein
MRLSRVSAAAFRIFSALLLVDFVLGRPENAAA